MTNVEHYQAMLELDRTLVSDPAYQKIPPFTNNARLSWSERLTDVVAAVRMYGKPLFEGKNVSRTRQVFQLLRLIQSPSFTTADYYHFRLWRFDNPFDSKAWPRRAHLRTLTYLYRRLNLDFAPLTDKRDFARRAAASGLPLPTTYADFSQGEVNWWGANRLPAEDLFVKLADGFGGKGAARWIYSGGRWHNDPHAFTEPELLSHLAESSRKAPLVLQRRHRLSAGLSDLGVSGLSTVRIITFRDFDRPEPRVLSAGFRIPAASSIRDNFSGGGLAAPIDLRTGELAAGRKIDPAESHIDFPSHPDTGGRILGRRLPMWDQVKELAIRAHAAYPEFPSVGWDIAIAESGLLLMEGNCRWGSLLPQFVKPFGETDYPRHFMGWLQSAPPAA